MVERGTGGRSSTREQHGAPFVRSPSASCLLGLTRVVQAAYPQLTVWDEGAGGADTEARVEGCRLLAVGVAGGLMRNRSVAIIALLAAPMVGAAQTTPPPSEPAPPPASATAPPPTEPEPEYTSYLIAKGGYFGTSGDFQGSSFSGNGTFEVAIGYGRTLGLEFASGYMKTDASGLEVETIPLLLSLRLALPITFVAPFAEVGGGAYHNKATIGGKSTDGWAAGWHAGLGCDLLLGRLLVGAEAKYVGLSQSFSSLGSLNLDRYELLARAGLRF